jgi:fumarate hydratase class II
MLGGEMGSKKPVHPNDHVNMGPVVERHLPDRRCTSPSLWTARDVLPARACAILHAALARSPRASPTSSRSAAPTPMDATPLTLGQEFGGYALQVAKAIQRHRGGAARILRTRARRHGRSAPGLNSPAAGARRSRRTFARLYRPALRRARPTSSRRWRPMTRSCQLSGP